VQYKTSRRGFLFGALSIGFTVVLCVLIVQHRTYMETTFSHWGYLGCFVVNVLASGTFVVPGTGAMVTFTLGGALNPAIVGAVAGLGEATGAVGAYLTGYGGRGLLINGEMQGKFTTVMQKHGSKAMFLMAAVINPIYYPFAVWMGVLRVKIGKFFLLTLLGRTLKNLVLAYLGFFGLRTVLQWFGIAG